MRKAESMIESIQLDPPKNKYLDSMTDEEIDKLREKIIEKNEYEEA